MRRRALLALTAVCGLLGALLPAAPAGAAQEVWGYTLPGWNRTSSPSIGDVNGDGRNDIVFGHQDGWVRVVDATTGANLFGWPQPAQVRNGIATAIDSSPTIADLDRDGANEVIVAAGSTWVPNQPGGIVVFRRDGSIRCRFETRDYFNPWNGGPPDGLGDGVYSTPAVGDVDGDSYPDIVFGGWDLHVHALDRNCNEITGFPYNIDDSSWSSPALYDSDGDGRLEIFIGGDQTPGGWSDWSGGEFRALDWANGGVRELWRTRINDVIMSSPAIGDINGDGRLEAVVGAGDVYHRGDGWRVWAWHLDNGSAVPGWPVTTGGVVFSSPALGDLTGDGVPEVVVTSRDGVARAYRGSGVLHWATVLPGGMSSDASPIIADLDGNGFNDVGVGSGWGFFVLNGLNGAATTLVGPMSYEAAGAVGDFGPAGWQLVTIGFDTPHKTTDVKSFSIPTPGTTPPWPMFRKNAAHLGADPSGGDPIPPGFCARNSNPPSAPNAAAASGYWILSANGGVFTHGSAQFYGSAAGMLNGAHAVNIVPTATGRGYYILSSSGGVFAFGDARFHGSMAGTRLNAPIIGIAATPNGDGYWLLGADGGVFSFGSARFYGSTGNLKLNQPIIGMAPTSTGNGYWLLARDGGVFSFGDAQFYGSTGALRLNAPIISMAPSPVGNGYWLIGRDGGIFSFNVPFRGSIPGTGVCNVPISMQVRPTRTGNGYYILGAGGEVYTFGDAPFWGTAPGLGGLNFAADLAVVP